MPSVGGSDKAGEKRGWRKWRVPEERKSSEDRGIPRKEKGGGRSPKGMCWPKTMVVTLRHAPQRQRELGEHEEQVFSALPSPPPPHLDSV